MERDDDPRLRQRAANLEQRFDAEPEHMMEVHDVGLHRQQVLAERAGEVGDGAVRDEVVVVVVRVQEGLALALPQARGRRTAVAAQRVRGPGEVERLHARQLVEAEEEVVRGDLGAAERKGRVSVRDDENSHEGALSQLPGSGVSPAGRRPRHAAPNPQPSAASAAWTGTSLACESSSA